MKIYHLLCAAAFFSLSVFAAQAQNQPLSPEEQEKRILEYVDARTQKLSTLLELEY